MMKNVMLAKGVVIVLLGVATVPVFPASQFSNLFYTVLISSVLLALCFASSLRHLVHPHWQMSMGDSKWRAVFTGSNWDLYPLDPLTFEMMARLVFFAETEKYV